MITFLTVERVEEIHFEVLRLDGGQDGLRDRGLLDSAVAQAQASFGGEYLHAFPFGMAAVYAFHIAENQPFLDGNKRTAITSALMFLDLNGCVVEAEVGRDRLYSAMLAVADHTMDKSGLAAVLVEVYQAGVEDPIR